jgi:hypothetical protein
MKMSQFIVAALGYGAALAIAAPQCTQQTTRGNWGFTCEGELPAGGASLRSLGTCSASRTAFWDCMATVNLGGQIVPQELHGQAGGPAKDQLRHLRSGRRNQGSAYEFRRSPRVFSQAHQYFRRSLVGRLSFGATGIRAMPGHALLPLGRKRSYLEAQGT